jgi:hypothetical protein
MILGRRASAACLIGACVLACSSRSDDASASAVRAGNGGGSGSSANGAGNAASGGTHDNGATRGGLSNGGGSSNAGATGSVTGPVDDGARAAACSGLPFEAADAGIDSGAACAGLSLEAERVDVDMYVMMDRSVSMAEKVGNTGRIRWDFVRDAVRAFVQDRSAANIGVGIQFFGQSGSRDDALDCDVSRYSNPAVPIGPASRVGTDLTAAVDAILPGGLTPTLPALEGAIAYGKDWAKTHPGRATVVVLVTDGFPTQCQNPVSVSEIADVARQAAESAPPVRTYAVGLTAGYNLDAIARAGGTNRAFLVDEGDITRSFVSTLLNISNNSLACEYEIPTPSDSRLTVDLDKVQVIYTPAVGDAEEVPQARAPTDCATSAAGGWYYDDPAAPSKIIACPCTCSRFAAGKVEVRLGCYPRRVSLR